MNGRYKIIVSGRGLYKEIELTPDDREVRLGTGVDCDVRLRRESFFGNIELRFLKVDSGWTLLCSDNLYMTSGDVKKMMTKILAHGDILFLKYQDSDTDVFSVEFLIDFENGGKKYERSIDTSGVSSFSIGSASGCGIVLFSPYVNNDYIDVRKSGTSLILSVQRAAYGVYRNGIKVVGTEEIKDGDFFSVSDFFFYYRNGSVWTEIRSDLKVNSLPYRDYPVHPQYPLFKRNTRVKVSVSDEKIEILDPPSKPQKPKNNTLMRLIPSLGMFLTAGIMALFGGMMIFFSAVSAVTAVVTAVLTIRENKKDYAKNLSERIEKYNAYIAQKKNEIENARYEEQRVLEEIYIPMGAEISRLNSFSPDLFDRAKDDDDFLFVRLGSGDVEAKRVIDYKKREKLEIEDELQTYPELLCAQYKYVHDAPIVCDFKQANAIGVVGRKEYRFEMMKNMVIDLVARQFFTDLELFFVAEKRHINRIRWLRMLPHVYNDDIGVRNIVTDDESKNIIFEYLYKELSEREAGKTPDKQIVVFLYDEYGFLSHPVSKFAEKASELGTTFVFFGNGRADIPAGCKYLIEVRDGQTGAMIDADDRAEASGFYYTTVSDRQAAQIVDYIAPVYTEEISLEGSLTKNVTLYELLHIIAVDDIDLKKRWSQSQVFKSMAAPIGVSKTGVVSLDLHDKADGPHGLVAGTTGSGKSELLQTYILSVATLFHPYEVGFVIIDFKGGGMVNQLRGLPHLLGAITNIDGKEVNRSLRSIKAELQKRQRLFAEADVNHIDKYIMKYKAGEATIPVPHLIVIVDEFAELKAEQPEFMKELISAARIGRSLGVHLILATQKPSGQVNEQIWSNSRFKLCLKVQSQEDSNEVLKSPLAAEIKEPGRAYLQVGNNEVFELFQSAYSGASEKADDPNVKEFTIYQLNDSCRRIPVYQQKKRRGEGPSNTQLDAIVKYVSDYCHDTGLRKLSDICLPALNDSIKFPELSAQKAGGDIIVDLGIYDDPDNQYQGTYSVDLTKENLMIIGSAQSGKTNLIQNIIRSISSKYSPREVNIYVIDFASMALKAFEPLNHVGGVVTPSEDEKLKNLIKLLLSEIEKRKEKLLSVGVSSFSAYREAGLDELPQIVLIIDNITALKELYYQEDDELVTLCREGLTVGISVVIANAQTSGIGYKYLSGFSSRIAMFCNDSGEYNALFDHCRERIDDIHGRCLVGIDKVHLECQAFLAFEGEKEIDRVESIREYVAECNGKNREKADPIPVIPGVVGIGYVSERYSQLMSDPGKLVVGFDYSAVMPFVLNLRTEGFLAVSGREGAGRHNFIKLLVRMSEMASPGSTEAYIIDGVTRKLSQMKDEPNVKSYDIVRDKAIETVKSVAGILKGRYEALASGDESAITSSKVIMLILNSSDAIEAIGNDPLAMEAFRDITGKYKSMNVFVLVGDFENANVPYGAPEILKKARDAKRFMFFDDVANLKIFDLPIAVMRQFKKPLETGDGYYIKDNMCVKIKTVKAD